MDLIEAAEWISLIPPPKEVDMWRKWLGDCADSTVDSTKRTLLRMAVAALAILGAVTPARGDVLKADRIDTTWAGPGTNDYRTWLASPTWGVMSRRDVATSSGTSSWRIHGAGSALAKAGVAATGYTAGISVYEIVAYAGTNETLNYGIMINDGSIAWYQSAAPAGKILTGKIAVTTFTWSGYRYLFAGLTTTDGKLYRYVANLNLGGAGSWADSSGGLNWSPTYQLTASTGASGAVSTIYAAHTPNTEALGMVRWTGSSWAITNLDRPTGKRACRSIAAAEGNLTGLSTGYRVLVACTSFSTSPELYVATATSENATFVTWNVYASPNSTAYQNVAAVLRPTSLITAAKAIDVYASGILQNRLHKGTQSSSSFSLVDLGTNPDGGLADFMAGSLTAVTRGTSSRAIFLNRLYGRDYLYERYGGTISQIAAAYRAFDHSNIPDEQAIASNHTAEAKASSWQGVIAVNAMRRPGSGAPTDWPTTQLSYSDSGGFYSDVTVTATAGGRTHEYVGDPTVAVTDQLNIYAMQLGVNLSQCINQNATHATVYAVATSPGTWPSMSGAPIVFESLPNNSNIKTIIDHPYMDIEHRSGLPDVMHTAWWVTTGATTGIRYIAFQEGATSVSPSQIVQLSTSGAPPRVTASDSGRVIVYYPLTSGEVRLCDVDAARMGCNPPGWQSIPSALYFSSMNPIVGANSYIKTVYPASMAVSESGDVLYYCYQRRESNGGVQDPHTDAFCTTATRDPSGLWVWDETPVAVAGVTNDDKDQFAPEVLVTREGVGYGAGQETAIVTFYDRSDDPSNYYYKVKKAVSVDKIASFYPPRSQFNDAVSDPDGLPRHCQDLDARFIGDYAGSEGEQLHGFSVSVITGGLGSRVFTNFNALGHWAR